MTDISGFGDTPHEAWPDMKPEEPDLRGRYGEGESTNKPGEKLAP